MLWINKQKIFNYYLPLFLAVVLIIVAGLFWYRAQRASQPLTIYQTEDGYAVQMLSNLEGSGQAQVLMSKDRPEVVLSKWDGQASLAVSYAHAGTEAKQITDKGQSMVEWKGDGQSLQAYPLKPTVDMEDGGLEIQVKLDQKPQNNRFNFAISGAENMDFLYQDSLANEFAKHSGTVDPRAVSCTDTECVDANNKVLSSRPENVIGSYAVYSKVLKNHADGETNFGSGKLFQIYRPKAIDAKGHEQWAELSYDNNGTLAVTVPQDFLDTANYPVVVDPTYGYTALGASEDNTDSCILNYIGGAYTGSTGSVITTGHWYGRSSVTPSTQTIYLGVYAGINNGDALLGSINGSAALTGTKTQYTIGGSGSFSLTNGTTYGIAAASDLGNGWQNEYDSGGTTGSYDCGLGNLEANWGGGSFGGSFNNRVSFYFDYGKTGNLVQQGGKYRQVGGKVVIGGSGYKTFSKAQTGVAGTTTSGTTVSCVFATNPTAGDLVTVGVLFYDGSTVPASMTVADSNGNNYSVDSHIGAVNMDLTGEGLQAYLLSAPANADKTITATFNKSISGAAAIWCDDFHVSGGMAVLDNSAGGASDNSTNVNAPTIPVSGSNDLLYSVVTTENTVLSANAPWVGTDGGNQFGNYAAYDLSATSSTALDYTVVHANWNSIGMSFK